MSAIDWAVTKESRWNWAADVRPDGQLDLLDEIEEHRLWRGGPRDYH
jgi:hypothetical protein